MSLINRTGTFRGRAIESGVALTSSGLPQYVLKCEAQEYFNEATGEWIDWLDVDENTITAYLCLFTKDNVPIFHAQDIQNVFNWDGTTLSGLDALDVSKIDFQFTVEEHLYNDKTSLQVSKIAAYSAVPGATIRRADAAALKALDAKFGAALLKNSGGKKAVSAPAKPATLPKPPKTTKTAKPPKDLSPSPAEPPTLEPPKTAAPPRRVTPPAPPSAPAITEYPNAEAAWEAVQNVRAKDVDDEKLAQVWGESCAAIAGDAEDEAITPIQWGQIVELVNKECAIF